LGKLKACPSRGASINNYLLDALQKPAASVFRVNNNRILLGLITARKATVKLNRRAKGCAKTERLG